MNFIDPNSVAMRIAQDGYVILERLLPEATLDAIRGELDPLLDSASFGTNSFVGRRTRRVFGLPAKLRALDGVIVHPLILGALDQILGSYQLSSTVAVEIHPGEVAQTLHTDASAWPVPRTVGEIVVNTMWAIDDFTPANGATRLLPGSHRNTLQPADGDATELVAAMPAGSVLVYLGSLWHGGGCNSSDAPRRGVIIEYGVRWLRQQENLTMVCPPRVARRLPARLQELLGYNLHEPFVGHIDGRHPVELLVDSTPQSECSP
jgi:ectoine hydroxylase-related dioxygenase (phytanoyl-CoA dioxygenase family)